MMYTPREQRDRLTHSIYNEAEGLHIPLKLDGVVSYFPSRRPSREELTDSDLCTHVYMTREQPWDPLDAKPSEEEDAIRRKFESETQVASMVSTLQDALGSGPRDHRPDQATVAAIRAKRRKTNLTPESLATLWRIGVETAKRTLTATTQLAVRDLMSATGDRRLKPTAYQLRFRRLRVEMYCAIYV